MSDEQERTSAFGSGRPGDGNHPPGGPRSGDGRTRPMPGVRDTNAWNADSGAEPVWAGRAAVRAPRPDRPEEVAWGSEPSGRWWTPIVVGLVVLVLLGLLGWAVWLIVGATGGEPETPAPVVRTATSAARAPAVTPTQAVTPTPTRVVTTTTAPAEEPATVIVPALRGLSQQEAQQALDRRGLSYRVIVRTGSGAPGTVIDSDPVEGQEVPAQTQVTLVVAAQRSTASSAPVTTGPSQGEG